LEEYKVLRKLLTDKKKIVIKIGSASLAHMETGHLNLEKMEKLVRILTNLRNQGKDVILVSSGAIAVGRNALGIKDKPTEISIKQACAAVGQARLMMVYQKLFAEYNQVAAQILMTKHTMINDISRANAQNTFNELSKMGVIPIVNENDTVSTDELDTGDFGDNDTLSAIVTAIVGADLLILLSDTDGFYTDDPHKNINAKLISYVDEINDELLGMAKSSTGCNLGTGGMATKLSAAKIANASGADMVITSGEDVRNINRIMEGKDIGTLFLAHKAKDFNIMDYIKTKQYS
jgi:glutamate 5-kinase